MSSYIDDLIWVAVDIETTGTNPYQHEIIEIGAVRFSLKNIEDTFQVLVQTTKKHDPRARMIHNITDEEVEEKGVSNQEALKKLLEFIENDPLIFHNAPFDLSFLIMAMNENNFEVPKSNYYDNLYISRTHFSERESHSLDSLRKDLKIDTGKSHRALADAEATARVFMASLHEKYERVNSKKDYNAFLRYHRKVHKFKIQLPKNFDKIENYFNRHIKTGNLLHIRYIDQNKDERDIKGVVKNVMIFNQNVFIKMLSMIEKEEVLIPLRHATIYDSDKGMLKQEDLK